MNKHRMHCARALVALTILATEAMGAESIQLRLPSGSTKESRTEDMQRCVAIAQQIDKFTRGDIGHFEASPLGGRPTGRFLSGSRPSSTEEVAPIAYASALGINWEQSPVSDRYVLCLLANGYGWPDGAATLDEKRPALSAEREASTLYESGRIYRLAGLLNEGERLLRRSVEMDGKRLPDDSEWLLVGIGEVAIVYLQLKRIDEGLGFVNRLVPNAEKYPRRKQFLWWIFSNYSEALRAAGREKEAASLAERAAALKS